MKLTLSHEIDIAALYAAIKRFNLRIIQCRGLFIGNTFIGIVRARK